MPKPNYQFEKRQRELEKKRKKEDKAQKKAAAAQGGRPEDSASPGLDGSETATNTTTPG
jgi:hypothetical protein